MDKDEIKNIVHTVSSNNIRANDIKQSMSNAISNMSHCKENEVSDYEDEYPDELSMQSESAPAEDNRDNININVNVNTVNDNTNNVEQEQTTTVEDSNSTTDNRSKYHFRISDVLYLAIVIMILLIILLFLGRLFLILDGQSPDDIIKLFGGTNVNC